MAPHNAILPFASNSYWSHKANQLVKNIIKAILVTVLLTLCVAATVLASTTTLVKEAETVSAGTIFADTAASSGQAVKRTSDGIYTWWGVDTSGMETSEYTVYVRARSLDGAAHTFTEHVEINGQATNLFNKSIASTTYAWYSLGTFFYNGASLTVADWSEPNLAIDKLRIEKVRYKEAETVSAGTIFADAAASSGQAVKRTSDGIYTWWSVDTSGMETSEYTVYVRARSLDGAAHTFTEHVTINGQETNLFNKSIASTTYAWYSLGTFFYNGTSLVVADWSEPNLAIDKLRIEKFVPSESVAVNMNVNGKWIRVHNLTAYLGFAGTSNGRVQTLVSLADTNMGGLMNSGDRVVVTNKYIAWMDLTYNSQDFASGGSLRGLWSLYYSGENLNFRPNGNWNELQPFSGFRGAGHVVMANQQCADVPSTTFYSIAEPSPSVAADGMPSDPYIAFPDGVAYQFEGHLYSWPPDGQHSIDLNPNINGNQSIAYSQRYDFSPTSMDIQVETYIWRDNAAGVAPVAILINNFDTAAEWMTGYGAPTARPLRCSYSNTTSVRSYDNATRESMVVGDLPPGGTAHTWWENIDRAAPGQVWGMSETCNINAMSCSTVRSLEMRLLYESVPSPIHQHVYTPEIIDYSLSYNPIHSCTPTNLDLGWSHRMRFRLTTRGAKDAECHYCCPEY